MSNVLYIDIGIFMPTDQNQDNCVLVWSHDQYGSSVMNFDDRGHLLDWCPTKEDLILEVLKQPEFEGGAIINTDGTYTLDAISAIVVNGFPM